MHPNASAWRAAPIGQWQAGSLAVMAGDSPVNAAVIVVGGRHDAFVVEAMQLAREYETKPVQCDDVYSAVAELAKTDGCVAVIGLFGEMVRENSAFFRLVRRAGTPCCCLLNDDDAGERDEILRAVRLGVHLVGDIEPVRDLLEGCLAAGRCASSRDDGLPSEDDRATEAELEALLEQEPDG